MRKTRVNYKKALQDGLLGDESTPLIERLERLFKCAVTGDLIGVDETRNWIGRIVMTSTVYHLLDDPEEWAELVGAFILEKITAREGAFFCEVAKVLDEYFCQGSRNPQDQFDISVARAAAYVKQKIRNKAEKEGKSDSDITSISVARDEVRRHVTNMHTDHQTYHNIEKICKHLESVGVTLTRPVRGNRKAVKSLLDGLDKSKSYTPSEIEEFCRKNEFEGSRKTFIRAAKEASIEIENMPTGRPPKSAKKN